MGGTGWCTHPKRQTSSDVRILVRKAELACRNSWGEDFWQALDSAEIDEPVSPPSAPEPIDPNEGSIHISFEDEVTSVVDADIHRAKTREDLSDRMVEEANLDPDEQDDDRFGLLARGGRDSVGEARSRMLRRRGGSLDLPGDDEPREGEPAPHRFAPDDFVEEEGPAQSRPGPSQDISPLDDVVLSENLPQGTPRSRRIRRERDRQSLPKTEAVVETSPDVPAPAQTPGAADQAVSDPFNTVPEIASNIDISTLRKRPHRAGSEPRQRTRSQEEPVRGNAFEEDIRSAQAIRAAARSEREGRHRQARRSQILLRPTEVNGDETSAVIAELAQSALARPHLVDEHVGAPEVAPVRNRMSTRETSDAPAIFEHSEALIEGSGHSSILDDPRTSWWRGMFQHRHRTPVSDPPYDDDVAEADVLAEVAGYDIAREPEPEIDIASSQPAWQQDAGDPIEETTTNDSWAYDDAAPAAPVYAPMDLDADAGMESFRSRLFGRSRPRQELQIQPRQAVPSRVAADALLEDPADAWYEPDPVPGFDLRRIVEEAPALLDMEIEISPEVTRQCATCRSYHQFEKDSRGWCTNNWAFTHRQMVNATDLACESTIGCWWLPADKEVWLDEHEPERKGTPRVDKLIAHLDPLKKVVAN